MKIIQPIIIDDRNMIVIGVPILLTIAVTVLPKEVLATVPNWANYLLSSGISVGALATVILNLIIPVDKALKSRNTSLGE